MGQKEGEDGSKTVYVPPVIPKPQPKPTVVIPADIVGKKVGHKSFGTGVITAIDGGTIVVNFDKVGEKKMGYEVCMKNKLLQFIIEENEVTVREYSLFSEIS